MENSHLIPDQFYRGTVLYFIDDPYHYEQQEQACKFYEDGLLALNSTTGKVVESGEYAQLKAKYDLQDSQINQDYVGKLILPGFIDCHTHYPQSEMIGAYSKSLLQWLNTYTFPTEKQFSSYEYARNVAEYYLEQLLQNGVTSALIFSTVHPESVQAIFDEALKLNMRVISGKTLMDRNAPDYLTDTPELAYSQSKELIEKYHKNGRCLYAITPRFAPTSTREQLDVVGKLKQEYPDTWIHTHMNENLQEIEWVKALFPENESYLDVYKQSNMLHKKSVFAHCIHCSPRDFDELANVQAGVAYCPTSNGFLGAGIFDYHKSVQNNMNFGVGTDIGAGTDYSILKTLSEGYKFTMVSQQNTEDRRPMSALKDFTEEPWEGPKLSVQMTKLENSNQDMKLISWQIDWQVSKIQAFRNQNLNKIQASLYQQNNGKQNSKFQLQEKLFGLMMLSKQENFYATHIAGVKKIPKNKQQQQSVDRT